MQPFAVDNKSFPSYMYLSMSYKFFCCSISCKINYVTFLFWNFYIKNANLHLINIVTDDIISLVYM